MGFIRYSPLPIHLFARLHLGRGHGDQFAHLGPNRLFGDGDILGGEIGHDLAQDVGIAGLLEIGRDHFLGVGGGGLAGDAELRRPKGRATGCGGLPP